MSELRLGGVHEVAELLGISKPALADRRRGRDFPKPLAELRAGPVWDLDEVEAYQVTSRPASPRMVGRALGHLLRLAPED